MVATERVPCAQYIRMSREHQRYSPLNQRQAIAEYAARRGFVLVQTYEDHGQSGLSLRGRDGLKRLLADVLSGTPGFAAILVLDVSRWGRFQDPDQAAHYEYLCRASGVSVHYCAEAFDNDGATASTIIKHLKRVMAAEFSRELGQKVFAGQATGARLGFKQGGAAPFGLRRMLVNEAGGHVQLLEPGQWKTIQTYRVVLVRGPNDELSAIRRIFRWYVSESPTFKAIAARLAAAGFAHADGSPLTPVHVGRILRNEIYTGTYSYNKTNQRLRRGLHRNSFDTWIRVPMLQPIISRRLFAKTQMKLKELSRPTYSREYLLNHLRQLAHGNEGFGARDIDKAIGPTASTYYLRFGSLNEALTLSGADQVLRERIRDPEPRVATASIIAGLKRVLKVHGYISSALISTADDLPSLSLVRARFGSLEAAYQAAGWPMKTSELRTMANRRRFGATNSDVRVKAGDLPAPERHGPD
jgi:DNA invertase Pin-like site-specific DNA recombinase